MQGATRGRAVILVVVAYLAPLAIGGILMQRQITCRLVARQCAIDLVAAGRKNRPQQRTQLVTVTLLHYSGRANFVRA